DFFENGDRVRGELEQLRGTAFGIGEEPRMSELDPGPKPHVARSALDRLSKRLVAGFALSRVALRDSELAEQFRARGCAPRKERSGACEQVDRGGRVRALPCAYAGRRQTLAGTLGESRKLFVTRSQLGAIPMSLLEVIADDFLGPFLAPLEPDCEPFMQDAPRLLRDSGVGHVADQDVVETDLI